MGDRLRFLLNRLSERLWVRPLAMCVLSMVVVFLAKAVDNIAIGQLVPEITPDLIETLLTIISASMLDVCFINTLPATVGAQHAAPLLPEGYALAQDLRNGHLVIATNRSGGTNDYAAARWHAATSAGSKEGAASSRRAASQAAVR
jgi:hypothetical protein